MTQARWIFVALLLGAAMSCGVPLIQRWPDIAVSFGNAWAEREKRLAQEVPARQAAEREERARREAAEREQEAREAADAEFNGKNCKVTVREHELLGYSNKVVTGVLRIRPTITPGYYVLRLSGGVERSVYIIHTENCR